MRNGLGAGRSCVVCEFLMESLVLSSAGALAGLGLAMLTLQLFRHMLERTLPLRTLMQFEARTPNAQIYVISGRTTFSACQILIAQVEMLRHAVFTGEPSL